ncbi:tetratricopeptide repeat protein [Dolichospermum sp. ST_sed9]|nr:tetratricopeptide repeat protein [Dolichospermum sp. ST_sed9]
MKLHKLSHLLLFFILLFPASGIIITGCSSSLFARKPGTLSESKLKEAEAYNNGGLAKSESGDKAGAIADYNQAITINPQLAVAYNNRGLAKSESGDKAGAIKDLETAKQLYQQQGNTQNAQRVQEILNKL